MISCQRSYDTETINKAVLECFDDITEDDTLLDCVLINTESDCWLELALDDVTLGFMQLSPLNRTTIDIHPYIFKQHRKHSKSCGIASIEWFDKYAPDMYKKLISSVPSCYPHIKRYTLSLGFELEGTYKKSFTKNGQLLDLWLFGRERK